MLLFLIYRSLFCLLTLYVIALRAAPPVLGGCQIFPPEDEWNRDISQDPVDPMSPCYIDAQFAGKFIRLDLGTVEEYYGIPYTFWNSSIPKTVITYHPDSGSDCNVADYSDESDIAPGAQAPIPADAPIEGGSSADPNPTCGDRHVLVIDNCMLYELFNTIRTTSPVGFRCSSSAVWDLKKANNRRPDGWTSADAAGLPILPGLLKYEEAATGEISHAIRFTVPKAPRAYTYPGNHFGPNRNISYPPYGTRFRLRSDWDESPYTGEALAIVKALKKYGMIFADQGSAIYLTGTAHPGWSSAVSQLNSGPNRIPGDAFEAVLSPYPVVYDPDWNPTPTCDLNPTGSGSTTGSESSSTAGSGSGSTTGSGSGSTAGSGSGSTAGSGSGSTTGSGSGGITGSGTGGAAGSGTTGSGVSSSISREFSALLLLLQSAGILTGVQAVLLVALALIY